jgi:hypothetical protein
VRTLLHLVHGAIIGAGALAVLALLVPGKWRQRRSLTDLKTAAATGSLVELAERRAAAAFSGPPAPASRQPGRALLVTAALASVVAAVVHGAVGPQHFAEGLRFGLFFVFLCAAQLSLAYSIIRRPSAALVAANALINAGTVLLWLLTRTVGLPFGLAEVESVGLLDVIATGAELVIIASCAAWLLTCHAPHRNAPPLGRARASAPTGRAG